MDVNTMDFSMLMEDEEDEAFDDSLYLNDAIDLVRSDANFGNTNQQVENKTMPLLRFFPSLGINLTVVIEFRSFIDKSIENA